MKTKKKLSGIADAAKSELGKEVILKVVGVGAGLGLGYLFVIKPLFQKLGIIKTAEEKEQENSTATNSSSLLSPFSPQYWRDVNDKMGGGAHVLTTAVVKDLAKKIYDAVGFFTDDENAVYAIMRQLTYKTQLSYLAQYFAETYTADLYNYLERNLDDSELAVVNNIASGLK